MKQRRADPLIKVCELCLRASCWQGVRICDFAVTASPIMQPLSNLAALQIEHPDYWKLPCDEPINAQLPAPNKKVVGLTVVSLLIWVLNGTRNISEAVSSGRTAHPSWREAHDKRLFVACAGGRLRLTDEGTDYLAEGVSRS